MDFIGPEKIKLQTYDTDYGVAWKFPIATGTETKDGAIPFGTTIASVDVTGWSGSTEAADLINGTPTISGTDTVQVALDYPTTTMSGVTRTTSMSLRFILTLSNAATRQFEYDNIRVTTS